VTLGQFFDTQLGQFADGVPSSLHPPTHEGHAAWAAENSLADGAFAAAAAMAAAASA